MILRTLLATTLSLLPLAAGCSARDPSERLAAQFARFDCGLHGAMGGYLPRPPGTRRERVENGDAVRACALPTAAEIELACEGEEGVPIPGSSDPDNPGRPSFRFPDHRVRHARCAFTDALRSRARCRFEIAVTGAAPAPVEAELIFRYRDLSNALVHEWHAAQWEVDAICRPA